MRFGTQGLCFLWSNWPPSGVDWELPVRKSQLVLTWQSHDVTSSHSKHTRLLRLSSSLMSPAASHEGRTVVCIHQSFSHSLSLSPSITPSCVSLLARSHLPPAHVFATCMFWLFGCFLLSPWSVPFPSFLPPLLPPSLSCPHPIICPWFPPPSPIAVLAPVRNSSSSLSSHHSSETGNVGSLLILADGVVVEHPEDFYRMQVRHENPKTKRDASVGVAGER